MSNLVITPATTLSEFLIVRKIRNSCRAYMTRDQSKIGLIRQIYFFFRYCLADRVRVIYIARDECRRPVGYGLIYYDDNLQPWITGGLLPAFRRKGYGEQIFRFLSASWHFPVWLEVREDNESALKLYAKLGFEEVGRKTAGFDTIITMRKPEED